MKHLVKTVIISLSAILLIYCILYIVAINSCSKNFPPIYEKEDNYILHHYYKDNKITIPSEDQLRGYIKKNYIRLFDGNQMTDYLISSNFHLKYYKERDVIFVYTNGVNFIDDKLVKIVNIEDVNFFNFLIQKGDILLFYTKVNNIKNRNCQQIDDVSDENFGIDLNFLKYK
jgi:hypothetical protein